MPIKYIYVLSNIRPKYNKKIAPITAITNDKILNPDTPIPKIMFAKNPPITAPNTPKTIVPINPPRVLPGSIIFAINPAIRPNMIQPTTSIG